MLAGQGGRRWRRQARLRTVGAGSVPPVWGDGAEGREGMLGRWRKPGLSFAGLLRQLRAEARLTQEELAEAASLSPRSVSDLERGINRTAHKDTALLLAGALDLAGPVRELFVAAARGKAPAADVLAARQQWRRERSRRRRPGRCRVISPASPAARPSSRSCWRRWPPGPQWRGGGHPRDRRDGGDRQDHLRGARRPPAGRGLPRWAVLLAAARPHRRAAAGRPGRCAGQLAADRRAGPAADPARGGGPGGAVAGPSGGQEGPAAAR